MSKTEIVDEQKPLLRLNETVPDFEATTSQGNIKLSDYKGKWVVLFSHPADFTPVCTTEFLAFTTISDDLAKRNVQLIGLSIDSVYSHIAWIRRIKEKMGFKVNSGVYGNANRRR
jgi:peroxiredoxin (alkyl hydroperoxide reductase subunit C)